jgi:BASS family bile acid:Na+ symporter
VLDLAYAVALIVTLWATAVGSGLAHRPSEIVAAAARRRRFVLILMLDAVAIPLFVYALARLANVPSDYLVGLVLVGAASAGAIGLTMVRIADADMPLAIGLVVVLETGNLVTIPAWSTILLSDQARPPLGDIIATLVFGVLVPLAVGAGLRVLRPARARKWAGALARVSTVGLVIAVAIIVGRDLGDLVEAWSARVPLIALATVLAALGAGWAVGGPERASRATAGLITSVRANTPALAVASASYGASSDAAVAIVVFALVSFIVAPLAAVWFKHTAR